MKLFKGMLLGAAAVATAATAQAADLPVAPEPVDYVRICDAYGARFYYIPGTETCLRVGGRVRSTFTINNTQDGGAWQNRESDGYTWATEGFIYLDANTATEFGTLRTFVELEGNVSNDVEAFDMNNAFIQWGGLTAGYLGSQFDHYTGQVFIGSITRNWSDTTTQQLSYTASFGNGFYVTGSIEEQHERTNLGPATGTTTFNRSTGGTTALAVTEGGTRVPDFVAAIGVSQGWGAAKLSGAIHQSYPDTTHNGVAFSGEDNLGWAVGASVLFNLDMLSAGSNIFFQGMYADGALSYIGYTPVLDSIGDDTASGYSLSAGLYYQATSTIGLAIDGSYASADSAKDTIAGTTTVVSQNDAKRWAIDGSVVWEPVSGLLIGGNVGYADEDISGGTDTESLVFGARIQRTF